MWRAGWVRFFEVGGRVLCFVELSGGVWVRSVILGVARVRIAPGEDALDLLHDRAIFAADLGTVTHGEGQHVGASFGGAFAEELNAVAEDEVAVLPHGHLFAVRALELRFKLSDGGPAAEVICADEGSFGEGGGFEAGSAEEPLVSDGEVLNGEKLLAGLGLIAGDEVGFDAFDVFDVFDAEDGVEVAAEAVLDGVAGGTEFTVGGFGSAGLFGVGAVGGDFAFRRGHRWGLLRFDA